MINWTAPYDLDSDGSRRKEKVPEPPGSPLHYEKLAGLKNLTEALIDFQEGEAGQVGSPNGKTPKQSYLDDCSTVLQYMNKDAYVNATGGRLHTSLQAASWFGPIDIVELLINHGADPNVYSECEVAPRCRLQHTTAPSVCIMERLLDTGAEEKKGKE